MEMMTLPIYFIGMTFFVRSIRSVLFHIYLWQLKEYRIDRMVSHLKTPMGRNLVFNPLSMVKLFLVIYIVFYLQTGFLVKSPQYQSLLPFAAFGICLFFFWLIWIFETISFIQSLVTHRLKHPKFTLKAVLLILLVFISQIPFIIAGRWTDQIVLGAILDRLLFLIAAVFVFLGNIPSYLYRKLMIYEAVRKIGKFNNLTVIGITGSFGKTSTKEFLSQILEKHGSILKTEEFQNTAIAVARTIIDKLESKHKIFIVEMGAYKKGEIAEIAGMVKPEIAIITGLNEQHLELFGSIKKTIEAKFELIENLAQGGYAVFNSDNKYCELMSQQAGTVRPDLKIWKYGKTVTEGKTVRRFNSVRIISAKAHQDDVRFILGIGGKRISLRSPLCGIHNIWNITAGICAALIMKESIPKIKQTVSSLKPPEKTMKRIGYPADPETVFIDDTFNSNPDAVEAAVRYMKIFPGKKYLVLTPLIELGKESSRIHQHLGEVCAKVCDRILLTNVNYNTEFLKGAAKVTGDQEKVQLVNTELAMRIIRSKDPGGVVVFEGKEAGKILSKLTGL